MTPTTRTITTTATTIPAATTITATPAETTATMKITTKAIYNYNNNHNKTNNNNIYNNIESSFFTSNGCWQLLQHQMGGNSQTIEQTNITLCACISFRTKQQEQQQWMTRKNCNQYCFATDCYNCDTYLTYRKKKLQKKRKRIYRNFTNNEKKM